MKSTPTRWLALLLCAMGIALPQLQAQTEAPLRPGWWTIALNGGLSYQQSDVPVRLRGGGIGLSLAKNLVHSPGGGFDIDLRGRLHYNHSFGLDTRRNFDIARNPAVNGTGLWNYLDGMPPFDEQEPFIFNNHKTQMGELGLEALVTLGSLREKTGVVLSGYAGIGLDWIRTRANQGNKDLGQDYRNAYVDLDIDQSNTRIRRALRRDILDRQHESLAEGFANHPNGRWTFMPYWGLELGYDLSKRWGIGLGHKVTYSGVDYLDGFSVPGGKQDLHHYTYAQVWYRFNTREKEELLPEIIILIPEASPHQTYDPVQLLEAEIKNIRNADQVSLTFNGAPQPFDYRRGKLSSTLLLKDGINTAIITAQNSAGKAQAEQIIILLEPLYQEEPEIQFIQPPVPGQIVDRAAFEVQAGIKNLDPRPIMQLEHNGRTVRHQWNAASETLSARVNLSEGRNEFTIRAQNRIGESLASTHIIYEKPILPPEIKMLQPDGSPHRTSAAQQAIRFDIRHIDLNRGDVITYYYNGVASSQYQYQSNEGRLTATVDLGPGQNYVTILVKNPVGEARAELIIIREVPVIPPLPRPLIVIQNQQVSPAQGRNNMCQAEVQARIQFIENRSQVQVQVGNRNISDFSYSVASGILRFSTEIPIAQTRVRITAVNPSGQSTEEVYLVCAATQTAIPAPQVQIEQPANQTSVSVATQNLQARVSGVNAKGDIRVTINGTETSHFTWNNNTGQLLANITLREGANTITVRATNAAGQAQDQVEIRYSLPQPPSVRIVIPANNALLSSGTQSFEALVSGITQVSQAQVRLNDQPVPGLKLEGDKLTTTLRLIPGTHVISARVQNEHGTATDTVTVQYINKAPEIVGRIPSQDTLVRSNRLNFSAWVYHVTQARDVKLSLNGRPVSRPSFNTETGLLSHRLQLNPGRNVILIEATNVAGKDRKQFNVNYDPRPLTPPVVTIISASQPAFDPFNPEAGESIVLVDIKHVSERSQITFLHNGKVNNGFTFENGRLEHKVPLQRGDNVFIIRAVNSDGEAEDTATVRY